MTAIADIISEAMIYIDDVRLQNQLAGNPALFYRRMSDYITAAMPLLSSPPELRHYLEKEYEAPAFDSYEWVSDSESTVVEDTYDVYTGKIGYELCSVVVVSEDGQFTTPYSGPVYDAETGIVTFPKQESVDITYEIDFYTDGSVADMTMTMKRLFGLAIAVVWDERFGREWLSDTMKIHDSSFSTVNESNYMDKKKEVRMQNRQMFQDELRKYEQDNAYVNHFRPNRAMKLI